MIRKLIRQMLTAQILSALTVSLCLLIDNIMIGRYLGTQGIAAYGLANPILLSLAAVASMLSAGVQVVCSASLGRGSQEEANRDYSSAVAAAAVFSLAMLAAVLLLKKPIALLLGAGKSEGLLRATEDYMAGFILGAPATMAALILVPFLTMAGKNRLLIAAVLVMTVTDVALDYLNVVVLKGGMFGMGLASSLSYYAAMLIGGSYFVSKKCVFRFSLKRVKADKIRALVKGGVPTVINTASVVVLVFVMNKLLLSANGEDHVAAFTVITTLGNAGNCVSTGIGGVALTMSGILYNEEDRKGLCQVLGMLLRRAVLLGAAAAALFILLAPQFIGLFMGDDGRGAHLAVFALRCYAPGVLFSCMTAALKNSYLGTGRAYTTEVISVFQNALFPILSALVLRFGIGMRAVWFYNAAGEFLALAGVVAWASLKGQRPALRPEDILLLPGSFGVPERDRMEADIRTMEDVVTVSRAAEDFCRSHGRDRKMGSRIALCIEEMGSNVIGHGFAPNGKNHLSIRLQYKDARWVLRLRDDCRAFDPVHYVPREGHAPCVGIRMVLNMADEVRYTYALDLNNLTVILKDREAPPAGAA